MGTYLVPAVFGVVITWSILKFFPSFKKMNWKIIFGAYVFLKLLDFQSAYLCFVNHKSHNAELNNLFLFYEPESWPAWLSHLFTNVIVIILGFFLIRVLLSKRRYFIPLFLLVIVLMTVINNYLGYFF
jgi:hypothetical protein